jgi:hypothetical protein
LKIFGLEGRRGQVPGRTVVGEVGLKLISWENRQGEIGFVFKP